MAQLGRTKARVLVTPADTRGIGRILRRLSLESCSYAYLGQSAGESARVAEAFEGVGTKLETASGLRHAAEELRGPYLAYLFEIGQRSNVRQWWLSYLSFKSCYISKAFVRTCLLKVAMDLVESHRGGGLLVLVIPDPVSRLALKKNLIHLGRPGVEVMRAPGPSIWRGIGGWVRTAAHRGFFLARECRRVLQARWLVRDCYVPTRPATLIVCSLTFRNLRLGPNFHRSFFGDLAERLTGMGRLVVAVPFIQRSVGYKEAISGIRESQTPQMVPHRYLKLRDVFWAATATWRKPPPNSAPLFNGMDIADLIEDERRSSWRSNWASDALLLYALARRWAALGISIDRIIYAYENQPWERALCLGVQRFLPGVELVGYQHSRTPRMLLNFHMAPGEDDIAPLPHRVVTVGPYTSRLLVSEGYREERVRVGGALQMEGLRTAASERSGTGHGKCVLVACSNGIEESAELIYAAAQLFSEGEGVEVIVKCHPIMPFERISALLSQPLPSHVRVSDEPINDLMLRSSLMIYSGSTVAIEALALGVPLLHLRPQFDLDLDPFEATPEARLDACGLEEARQQANWLLDNREEHVARNRRKWADILDDMYGPINDAAFRAFVD